MEQHRWHIVSESTSYTSGVWRFQRREVLALLVALGLGAISYRVLSSISPEYEALSMVVGGVLPFGTGAFLLLFVTGKPPGYAGNMIRWRGMQVSAALARLGFPVPSCPLIELDEKYRKTH